ncbi:hypothetical protein EVAR_93968_1 [Eumeta japonica]|uniref:Platelet-derived growth factor (PDGF) family profile domain-containing protein n=1 Tax=Eumeta variegata TaxID=151549 RepID=A0A4C1TP97_EUMVA|nr:hypothetical protein EVAR_93968_1 [Eumeta japonica]
MHACRVLLALLSVMTAARAAPPTALSRALRTRRDTFVQKMELSAAANRALCPVEVIKTEDPERVPRYIKEVRCAHSADHRRPCCRRRDRAYQCTELRDDVLVYYPRERRSVRETVSVGCACVERRTDITEPAPHPPE